MPTSPLIGLLGPIIGAIVGAILAALFTWYRTRVRRRYLVCKEIARTTLEVIEELREETEIRYGGKRVEKLSLEKLRFLNSGVEVARRLLSWCGGE